MLRTGIIVDLIDNTSNSAKRISDELSNITEGAGKLNRSLDPGALDDYYKKLGEIKKMKGETDDDDDDDDKKYGALARGIPKYISGVGRAFTSAGRGDVGTGISGAAGTAGDIISTAGGASGAAGAAGIAALIAGATIGAGNALSNLYENRMSPAMDIVATGGQYEVGDFEENTRKITEAISETSEAIRKYGKTYEEGIEARRAFMTAGGEFDESIGAASEAAKYSATFGIDMMGAAAFQGMAERYGAGENVLDITHGLMFRQELGPGQYDELLQGMEQIFTAALSGGVTKDIADIATSAEYFGRAGEVYRGGLGAGFLQGLDQTVSGATGLQRQEDIFLFRAASGLAEGNFLETMKTLERGFTGEGGVDLFQSFMEEIAGFTGGDKEDMVKQIRNALGVTYTQAEDLFDLYKTGGEEMADEDLQRSLGETVSASRQQRYFEDKEFVAQAVIETMGEQAFEIKSEALNAARNGIIALGETVDTISDNVAHMRQVRDWNIENRETVGTIMSQRGMAAGTYRESAANTLMAMYMDALDEGGQGQLAPVNEAIKEGMADSVLSKEEMMMVIELLRGILENTNLTATNTGEDQEFELDISGSSRAYADQYINR